VSVPESLKLDKNARAAPLSAVTNAIAMSLGVPSNEPLAWDVISSADLFTRPVASVSVVFDAEDISISAPASFKLAHKCTSNADCMRELLSGQASGFDSNLANIISNVFMCTSHSLAVSSNEMFADAATGSHGAAHKVAIDEQTKVFRDFNEKAPIALDAVTLSNIAFGPSVVYDASQNCFAVTLADGSVFHVPLAVQSYAAFISEIVAAVSAVSSFPVPEKRASPDVITIVIASIRAALADSHSAAAKEAIAIIAQRFVEVIRAKAHGLYGARALVTVVTLPNEPVHASNDAVLKQIVRRQVESYVSGKKAGVNVPNGPNVVMDESYSWWNVPYCSQYQCFCRFNGTGFPFDPTTGCTSGPGAVPGDCVNKGCPCSSPNVMGGLQQCVACAEGMVLYNGYCYVDSIYPATFNIVLWLGIALTLGLIATCYTIGGMDPGRNSAIYRTATHAKSS